MVSIKPAGAAAQARLGGAATARHGAAAAGSDGAVTGARRRGVTALPPALLVFSSAAMASAAVRLSRALICGALAIAQR